MDVFSALRAEIGSVTPVFSVGRISAIGRDTLSVSGLSTVAALGDRVLVRGSGTVVGGEVLRIARDGITILADGAVDGLAMGDAVELLGRVDIAPDDPWLGRIIDPFGKPLDGRPLMRGPLPRMLRAAAPDAAKRGRLGARLATGVAAFDTVLPLVQGQRIGLFAGSGVGKSSLLAKFARGVAADVVVIALIGERGRELRDFTDHVLGPQGLARSVVVAATSDQSPLIRRRCAWAAMAVAEHFRDQGLHVLFLADSVTRFAEAHREVALAAGETASLRGYPPSVAHMIMSLAERAGPGPEGVGAITAIFSVLVPGSDMEEPVADILRGTLDGHVVMDRKIAERGRYPAIDLLRSVSRSLPGAATEEENALITEARRLLGAYDRAELMIQAGLYSAGSDPLVDRAIKVWPALDAFMAEDAHEGVEGSFRRLAKCLGG
ncbi:MAG: flagellum-specific ATP synthase FliI [Cereibacter sphaeroides]|uniref:Flagellum-specific ATP synthase FliI n=1 Tax=Cereibacter sphaeroides TaxID=1063 RepID=A0A2W5U2P1_CERSP|nr:MAG: flagellum-specific ATP synthase FliI [Cereibacter sphaeroides]